jgi:ferredoxin-NADP reductase
VVAAALILVFRFGHPFALFLRHRLVVAEVEPEGDGVVSIYVTGRRLDRLAVRAGQHFRWRFLARDGWWRAHPFSLSAAPNGEYLRLTVKDSGDWSGRLQFLHPGTRIFAEGPYGTFTGERRLRDKVLLIAGGIGITPIRALLEELPTPRNGLTLLYRATSLGDVIFRDEVEQLVRARGATFHMLIGRRHELPVDPLSPAMLRQLVPDIGERDVFVCGPAGLIDHVRSSLGSLGVPAAQVHSERFAV